MTSLHGDRLKAYLTIYNIVQEHSRERPEAVAADTERVWGLLSERHKAEIALSPAAAVAIVSDAMSKDPALAAKLPRAPDAHLPTPAHGFFDGLGRTPFDRLIAGNNVAGFYAGTSPYADLAGSSYDASKGLGALTRQNFATSEFYRAGLDYSTVMLLASQNFSPVAILGAARATTELGIDVKTNIAAMARLTRDVPKAMDGLRETKSNWQAVGQLEREAHNARQRGDTAAAAELQRQADEARRRAEEHDRKEREAVRASNPDRLPDLQQLQNATKQAALASARDAKIDPALIDAAHRGDPEAIAKLGALRAEAISPGDRAAFEQLDQSMAQNAKLKARVVADQTEIRQEIAAADVEGDDLLTSINGPTAALSKRTKRVELDTGEKPGAPATHAVIKTGSPTETLDRSKKHSKGIQGPAGTPLAEPFSQVAGVSLCHLAQFGSRHLSGFKRTLDLRKAGIDGLPRHEVPFRCFQLGYFALGILKHLALFVSGAISVRVNSIASSSIVYRHSKANCQ